MNFVIAERDAEDDLFKTGVYYADQFSATIAVGSKTVLLILLIALALENSSIGL
jgi:hypothetical protein